MARITFRLKLSLLPANKIFKNASLLSIAVAVLFHVVIVCSVGSFYEVGSDTYFKNVCSGTFLSAPQAIPLSFGGQILFSNIYAFLYDKFPAISWYDISSFTFSIIACALLIFLIFRLLELNAGDKTGGFYKRFAISSLLSVLIYYEGSTMIELTRFSTIISVCSLTLLLFVRTSRVAYFILVPLLILSMFFRPETFPFSVLLALPLIWLARPTATRLAAVFVPAVTAYLILVMLCNFPFNEEERSYLHFRPYQFALIDYKIGKRINNFANERDSLSLTVARRAFWNDSEILNDSLFKRYLPQMDKTPRSLINYLKYTNYSKQSLLEKISKTDTRYAILLLIPLVFFITALFSHRKLLPPFILIAGYYILLLYLITLFLKIENRIVYPVFIAYLLTTIALSAKSKSLKNASLIAIALALLIFDILLEPKISDLRNIHSQMNYFTERLKASPDMQGKVLLFDEKALTYTGLKLFEKSEIAGLHTFSIDNGILFMNAQYKSDCMALFGTTITADIMKKIAGRNNRFLWVGTISRTKELINYFRVVHHIPLRFDVLFELQDKKTQEELPALMKFSLTE